MFVIKRNHVIIVALVIMVGVAGYLNYMDNNLKNDEIILNDNGEISALVPDENLPVNANLDSQIEMDFDKKNSKENKFESRNDFEESDNDAIAVNKSMENSYFVQAKLDREQARAKQKEILDEMINNKNLSESKKTECVDNKIEIQKRIEKESAAESLLESKGFDETYVRIDDETVDVVINKEMLSDAEIAQIEDIVKRKTGFKASQIRISTLKK
ncbi:MAG: SpoIIIAH-like family protein [Firmicutes bacterium]|nr:SpoIIIAH-like family protein [Bacillota bacterium]